VEKTTSKLVQRLLKKKLLTEELLSRANNAQKKSRTKVFVGEVLVEEFKKAVKEAIEADPVDITELVKSRCCPPIVARSPVK
jgi:hypothetical protein